jgi:hypothetical protein
MSEPNRMVSRVSPPKPNRNVPPAKATDTEVTASGDALSVPAFLLRNSEEQVAAISGTNGGTALLVVADSPSGAPLPILEVAKRALADAKTVEEVKSIRDKALGLATYAKQASNRQLEAEATAIRREAERRLGQMMQQQKETIGLNKGGRPKTGILANPVSDQPPTLAEAGISKNLAQKARSAAAMSDEEFQAEVDAERAAVRTGAGSRKKSPAAEARAAARRAEHRERKRRTYLEKSLSVISSACEYNEEMELPSALSAAEIDTAIATVKEAIGKLNKLIGRLKEARPHK